MNHLLRMMALFAMVCTSLHAQAPAGAATVPPTVAPSGNGSEGSVNRSTAALLSGLAPSTLALHYMDTTTQTLIWRIQAQYPDFTMINLSQRFTLPVAWGRLDSVAVLLRELPLGEIRFDVWADTLRQRRTGIPTEFHYPSYFFQADVPLDTARLKSGDLDTLGYTMIRFNGKVVPKEFHILIASTVTSGVQSLFAILSDTKRGDESTITPEAARSVFLANLGGLYVPVHFYGFFAPNSVAIAPDLYMIAFVTIDPTDAVDPAAIVSDAVLEQNYPNPIRLAESPLTSVGFSVPRQGPVTLEAFDVLGRRVRTLADAPMNPGRHLVSFDARGLPPGTYFFSLRTSESLQLRPFTVVR